MVRILITGAAGNIGSALVDRLLREPGYSIVGVDNFLTGSRAKLPHPANPHFTFVQADVNDFSGLKEIMSNGFDFVFHYAAVVGVQRTLENPILVLNDIQGVKNVLDLCRDTGVKRVFFSSSSEVYGEPVEFPQNETTTPLNSRLPYAVVKNVAESFLRSYHKEYNLSYTIFRFFNTYGPRQSEDFVISRFLRQALRNDDIFIYGDGLQTRTFCYIDDNIETTLTCLRDGLMINDVMNIGSDIEYSIKDLANLVIDVCESKSKIVYLPRLKEGDMTRRKPDNSKMMHILGKPLIPLELGLKLTLRNLR
jgi:UDP-glucuronate decarboxylase